MKTVTNFKICKNIFTNKYFCATLTTITENENKTETEINYYDVNNIEAARKFNKNEEPIKNNDYIILYYNAELRKQKLLKINQIR